MRTLVIDSATETCSVALFEGDALLAGDCRQLGRGHAEALVPMIAALPGRGRAERIVVSVGPGSFTGVRVGLAAARALSLAWGSMIEGFTTHEMVAAMARHQHGAVALAVAMTGGHGEWFVAAYGPDGEVTRPLASMPPVDALRSCTEELVAGPQAEEIVNRRGFGTGLTIWPDARCFPLLPAHAISTQTRALYGRAPDAKLPTVRP